MDKPLEEWDVKDLKVACYDELIKLEVCKNNIRLIQTELRKRNEVSTLEGSKPREE